MELIHVSSYAECGGYPFYQYRCCGCNAMSPPKETEEDACAAATRRPPNLPLTKEQIMGMPDDDALWLIGQRCGSVTVYSAGEIKREIKYYTDVAFAFSAKPAPDDIEAARKKADK